MFRALVNEPYQGSLGFEFRGLVNEPYQGSFPGGEGGCRAGRGHLLPVPAVDGPVVTAEQRSPLLVIPLQVGMKVINSATTQHSFGIVELFDRTDCSAQGNVCCTLC